MFDLLHLVGGGSPRDSNTIQPNGRDSGQRKLTDFEIIIVVDAVRLSRSFT